MGDVVRRGQAIELFVSVASSALSYECLTGMRHIMRHRCGWSQPAGLVQWRVCNYPSHPQPPAHDTYLAAIICCPYSQAQLTPLS
jgi:hypothetical protein